MVAPTPLRSDALRAGAIIAGRYRVEEVLGRGGMGLVLAATHLGLGRRVAIKVVLPSGLLVVGAVERFEREARAAAALRTEHVVKVIDFGRLDSGAPFLVMEHLEGADLSRVLEQRGTLPVPEAVDLVLQATEAIAEAHAEGIIHRDIKPPNLFLVNRPRGASLLKVLDFGLSKMRVEGVSTESLTGAHIVAGSPHYMSPEQVQSLKAADARTDVWALGVVLFELLTGRRPFEGNSNTAILVAVTKDPPPSPRGLCPDIPEALEAVILRCLEKASDRRVQTAVELARLLAPFASRRGRAAVEQLLDTPETPGMPVAHAPEALGVPGQGAPDTGSWSAVDSSAVTTIPRLPRDSSPRVEPDDVALVSTDPAPPGGSPNAAPAELLPNLALPEAPVNPVLLTLPMGQAPVLGPGQRAGSPAAEQSTLVSWGAPAPAEHTVERVSTLPDRFAHAMAEPRVAERRGGSEGRSGADPAPLPPPPPPAWTPAKIASPAVLPPLASPMRGGAPPQPNVPVLAEVQARVVGDWVAGPGSAGSARTRRRSWQWWILGGAGVGLLLGLGAAAIVRASGGEEAMTSPSSTGAAGAGASSAGAGEPPKSIQDTPGIVPTGSGTSPLVEPVLPPGTSSGSTSTGAAGSSSSAGPRPASHTATTTTPSGKGSSKTPPPVKTYK